jgi:hypothetical protein
MHVRGGAAREWPRRIPGVVDAPTVAVHKLAACLDRGLHHNAHCSPAYAARPGAKSGNRCFPACAGIGRACAGTGSAGCSTRRSAPRGGAIHDRGSVSGGDTARGRAERNAQAASQNSEPACE